MTLKLTSVPIYGIQHDGSRLVQVLRYEDASRSAIESGHLNAIGASVRPVEVARHPVHRNSIWMINLVGDQSLGVASIDSGAADGPHLIVRPVDVSFNRVIVNGDCMPDVTDL